MSKVRPNTKPAPHRNSRPAPLPEAPTAWLNEVQMAEYLGVTVSFLRDDRQGARAVPFSRVGTKLVRYSPLVVNAALAAATIGGTPAQ